MKIGILGAMLEEVSSIKKLMVIEKESTIAGRDFLEGKIGDVNVVLTFSRWGKVNNHNPH
jgi:adenosylhomocysteine nucleosidase